MSTLQQHKPQCHTHTHRITVVSRVLIATVHPPQSCLLHCTALRVCVCLHFVCLNQNVRVQESRAGFSGSVSIPSITKNRGEPGRSMSASSGLGIRE